MLKLASILVALCTVTLVSAVPATVARDDLAGGLVLAGIQRNETESLEKRNGPGLYFCLNAGFNKPCSYQANIELGSCYQAAGTNANAISSLGPDRGIQCWGFLRTDCKQDYLGPIVYPGIDTVAQFQKGGVNFNDAINSVICYAT